MIFKNVVIASIFDAIVLFALFTVLVAGEYSLPINSGIMFLIVFSLSVVKNVVMTISLS